MKALTIALCLFVSGVFQQVQAQTNVAWSREAGCIEQHHYCYGNAEVGYAKALVRSCFLDSDYSCCSHRRSARCVSAATRLLKNQEDIGTQSQRITAKRLETN
jgi:hypothetical protein